MIGTSAILFRKKSGQWLDDDPLNENVFVQKAQEVANDLKEL